MKDRDRIIIQKIIGYIDQSTQYILNMQPSDFFDDDKTIFACAFVVSQMGELVKEISDETIENYKSIPWTSIKGMRNRIVHDYENVDLSMLWRTIKKDLPELKNALKEILFNDNTI